MWGVRRPPPRLCGFTLNTGRIARRAAFISALSSARFHPVANTRRDAAPRTAPRPFLRWNWVDPDALQTMFISQVSDDLLVLMLSTLPAADLRLAAATCSHWRECVPAAAGDPAPSPQAGPDPDPDPDPDLDPDPNPDPDPEIRLRRRRPGIPVGHDAVPCWLRSLFTLELLAAAVGPMPAHSWREDYIELHHQAP